MESYRGTRPQASKIRYALMNCYLVDTLALRTFWRGNNFWVMKHLTLNQHLKPQLFAWIGERWEISNRLVREICKIGWKFKVLTTTQLSSSYVVVWIWLIRKCKIFWKKWTKNHILSNLIFIKLRLDKTYAGHIWIIIKSVNLIL